ncbi:uncharacterized protein LOC135710387 [Ochlerotatus camptorhynchus]|uniref:uncharacterized protein LOC135710387 n=1 Tax=Ochlerotatus camptorhynchus TaxID=644619 RepID=UPI0031E2BF28
MDDWKAIAEVLHILKVPDYLCKILRSYFQNRVLVYETYMGQRSIRTTVGVPQGCILGPMLWNGVYNGVLTLKLPKGVEIVGFADDVVLTVTGETLEEVEMLTTEMIDMIGCDGKCVPKHQCNDVMKTLDLRLSTATCPVNNVCCKNVIQSTGDHTGGFCDGECVFPFNCPDHGKIITVNLRLADGACPDEKICCNTTQKSNLCNGSCIPREQCDDKSIDLRFNDSICPGTAVCCKRPKTLTSVSTTSGLCDGTCLSRNQCSDKESINLRAFDGLCPGSQICCKVPKKQSDCDGTCAPLNQCLESQQNINLRYTDGNCPSNQICCKKLKTPESTCNGKCVLASKCSRKSLSSNPIDLQYGRASCPVGEVCCQDLEVCDGSCVPKNQCDDTLASGEINLRYGKPLCPINQVCCKNRKVFIEPVASVIKTAGSCDGTCLPRNQCSDKESINLRAFDGFCQGSQICCKEPKKQSDCDGTCAPLNQCLDSQQNINLRYTDGNCPSNQICCKKLKTPESTCNGKCVLASKCSRKSLSSNPIDLQYGRASCPVGEVCCQDLEDCDGSCVPKNQCDDTLASGEINLRYGKPLCPLNQVCCKNRKALIEPVASVIKTAGSCDGTCLPRNQCSDKESINLRAFDGLCPGSQICCKEPKKQSDCDGTCAPLNQCLDSQQNINLRYTDGNCPSNQICCKKLKTPESTCNGKCVLASKCSRKSLSSNPIDLRFGRASCPVGEVCCQDLEVCDGSCVPKNQCDDTLASGEINLRYGKPLCPINQVCCKNRKVFIEPVASVIKTAGSCDGTCLPRNQCSDKESINLRAFDGFCQGSQICCKEPKKQSDCDGTCAPLNQCLDSQQNINLRYTDGNCPSNQICCKKLKTPESTCNGKCVLASKCSRKSLSSNPIDLRFGRASCPVGEVCCQDLEVCDGSCVPKNQCDDTLASGEINLRYGKPLCPINQVCCKNRKVFIEPVASVIKTAGSCDGTCLPRNQCSDKESINLRAFDGFCQGSQICCKEPKKQSDCDGTCAPLNQCLDSQQNINLRYTDGNCPSNQICCKKLKTPESTCNGKCVLASKCSRKSLSSNPIDLQYGRASCPVGEVCCQDLEDCDGSCVPKNQCDDTLASGEINLRYGKPLCPLNQVCCKNRKALIEPVASVIKTAGSCDGTCLPRNQCSDKESINLRAFDGLCPGSQICCKEPKKQSDCDGTCAPLNQCLDSQQNINLRYTDGNCPSNQICCKKLKTPESTCNGKCVLASKCSRKSLSSNPIDLRFGRASCPVGEVCCQDLEVCDGSCVPKNQCDDTLASGEINLRYGKPLCPINQVCCKNRKVFIEPVASVIKTAGSCDGTCLPRNQCSDKESINLRAFDGFCQGSQICCKEPKKQSDCDGTCAPLNQCLDSQQNINLRYTDGNCPSNQICCKKLKTPESTCNGKCVLASKCSRKSLSSNPIDLRFGRASCPVGEVCCQDLEVCDGSCVPKNQCDDTLASGEINLRYGKPLCPLNQVCCKNRKALIEPVASVIKTAGSCDGTCLPRNQCSDKESINLRAFDGLCPGSQICCKEPKKQSDCDGTCAPLNQCLDSQQNINLRYTDGNCPSNQICCKKLKTPESTCNGKCVLASKCSRKSLSSNPIDLRFGRASCPVGEVCCQDLEVCDGSCVPKNQCDDTLASGEINLRYGKPLCPLNQVCCKNRKALIEPVASVIKTAGSCDGTCLPRNQCSDKESINLRAFDGLCPGSQICCKEPKKQSDCDGTCAPLNQCLDSQQNINLRYTDGNCPSNQICCKKLKTPESTCNGKCVLASKCSRKSLSSNPIDLRFGRASCPVGEVCCQDLEVCDGSCVPKNQCDDTLASGEINLRYGKPLCPINQVCCKNRKVFIEPVASVIKTAGSCDGTCLPRNQCSDKESINLRAFDGFCQGSQICCKEPKKQSDCDGTCAPLNQCLDSQQNINLRYTDGNCPGNRICCKNLKAPESTCNGKCVLASKCSRKSLSSNPIDLQYGRASCPVGEVCCQDLEDCDGSCVPKNQCDDTLASGEINLRYGKPLCPINQVCCKNRKVLTKPFASAFKTSGSCDGTCLPRNQCSDKESINLRAFDGVCSGTQICCKVPKKQPDCDGTCAPLNQCLDSQQNINLRYTDGNCPNNQICCKKLKTPESTCNGKCVLASKCSRKSLSSNPIDLQYGRASCPVGEVCCQDLEDCDGSCVPKNQCDDTLASGEINLRYGKPLCPLNQVCCKNRKVFIEPVASVIKTAGSCDGTCLPRNQCSDKESINLRAFDGLCPGSQICCKVPKKQPDCDGTCAPLNQCLDSQQNINLRYTDGNCPSNQICCKKLKTPESTCNGKCVLASKCSRKSLSSNPVDLRFGRASCPVGEVCCQDLEVCDGSCVPKNQCDVSSVSEGINLRYGKPLCPINQVCCKKAKKCDGSCVPTESCPSVDLRLATSECPLNQVCCKIPEKSETCKGICTQLINCDDKLLISAGINLRSPGGSCPQNEICCKNLKSFVRDVCDGKCVSQNECPVNNIDLRSPNGKCPPNKVCCKTDSCIGTCVLSELCADVGINLRYEQQKKCPMKHVCCQKLKEQTKAACPGQCLLPRQCPNYTPGKSPIDLRLIDSGCSNGQICCEAQIPFLPPSIIKGIPNALIVPISPTSLPQTLSSGSDCSFSSDPSAEYVVKADVSWLATIWSRREIFGIQRPQYECVGTLIKSDLVLTSADCLKGLSEEQLYARIGDFNLKPLNTLSSRREINITEVTLHPDFDSKTGFANLAVLHLSKNASTRSSVCLPELTKLDPMAPCFLVGWNKLDLMNESIPNASPDKHSVALTSAKCDEGFICTDENQSKSQCADAFQGSPVICFIGSSRTWVQTGLTAGSSKKCNTLAVPHSFVSIAFYKMWIKEQIMPSFQQIKSVTNPLWTYLPPVA